MGVALDTGDTIFFDTSPFIYYFEDHPVFGSKISTLLDTLYERDVQLVTSTITYLEIVTQPFRESEFGLIAKYRDFFTNSENISVYPVTLSVAEESVRYRVHYGLKTPDAIQCAVARMCGADLVVSHDRSWKKIEDLNVLCVEDL